MARHDSPTAVGGMVTKIEAAKIATKLVAAFIGSGEQPSELSEIINGQAMGIFSLPPDLNFAREKMVSLFSQAKRQDLDRLRCS